MPLGVAPSIPSPPVVEGASKIRVLVIDDDADIRSVLRIFLELHDVGFDVVGAVGGAGDALACVKEHQPEVVVLDLVLTGVAGLDIAEHLLAYDPELPIVVFSAYLHPAVVAHAQRLGIRDCVEKAEVGRLADALALHARAERTDSGH